MNDDLIPFLDGTLKYYDIGNSWLRDVITPLKMYEYCDYQSWLNNNGVPFDDGVPNLDKLGVVILFEI